MSFVGSFDPKEAELLRKAYLRQSETIIDSTGTVLQFDGREWAAPDQYDPMLDWDQEFKKLQEGKL